MNKNIQAAIIVSLLFIGGATYFGLTKEQGGNSPAVINAALAAQFSQLSENGNSSCSGQFQDSIDMMSNEARLQGSCCSPMEEDRYLEQIKELVKYRSISEIPQNPYDVEAGLAKKLKAHYDDKLSPKQQREYDYAMTHSDDHGPCCCKCWRWYVYGGLGKLLIQKYHFTGEQVAQVWNLSDACGGDDH